MRAVVSNGDGRNALRGQGAGHVAAACCRVPAEAGELAFVWLEQVIIANLRMLFPDMEILKAHVFHVTRDAELAIQELESRRPAGKHAGSRLAAAFP